jgi:hypothetical protein
MTAPADVSQFGRVKAALIGTICSQEELKGYLDEMARRAFVTVEELEAIRVKRRELAARAKRRT